MTTYDDSIFDDIDFDAFPDPLDDFPEADWYCNHDVPNGCRDCAWLRAESEMLENMSEAERRSYFAAQDERDAIRGFDFA